MHDDKTEKCWIWFWRNGVRFHIFVDKEDVQDTLFYGQWKPLLRMYLDEETTVATLARGCHLDAGAMTRLLDRLEAKGLCRRTRSLEDRRVVNLELTPEGRTAAEQIPGIVGRVQDVAAQGFSHEEFQQLRGFLTRLLDNVQVFGSPPCHNENEGSPT